VFSRFVNFLFGAFTKPKGINMPRVGGSNDVSTNSQHQVILREVKGAKVSVKPLKPISVPKQAQTVRDGTPAKSRNAASQQQDRQRLPQIAKEQQPKNALVAPQQERAKPGRQQQAEAEQTAQQQQRAKWDRLVEQQRQAKELEVANQRQQAKLAQQQQAKMAQQQVKVAQRQQQQAAQSRQALQRSNVTVRSRAVGSGPLHVQSNSLKPSDVTVRNKVPQQQQSQQPKLALQRIDVTQQRKTLKALRDQIPRAIAEARRNGYITEERARERLAGLKRMAAEVEAGRLPERWGLIAEEGIHEEEGIRYSRTVRKIKQQEARQVQQQQYQQTYGPPENQLPPMNALQRAYYNQTGIYVAPLP
jgi:hypothetical protein